MSGVKPLAGVPMVRVLDEEGREVLRGWCVFHEGVQPYCWGGELKAEDCHHCVAVDGFADWGMPRSLEVKEVTPPHRIEVIDHFADIGKMVDRDALLRLADDMSDRCEQYADITPETLAGYAQRIRNACGSAE